MRHVQKTFKKALNILDKGSEDQTRLAIENGLYDVTGPNNTKRNAGKKAVEAVMAHVTHHRTKAFKDAFRHLKKTLPPDEGEDATRIYGKALGGWAQTLLANDLKITRDAIEHGIRAGDSSSDIAHRVIGSRKHGGRNGATEQTRQHIIRLARGYVRKKLGRDGPEK